MQQHHHFHPPKTHTHTRARARTKIFFERKPLLHGPGTIPSVDWIEKCCLAAQHRLLQVLLSTKYMNLRHALSLTSREVQSLVPDKGILPLAGERLRRNASPGGGARNGLQEPGESELARGTIMQEPRRGRSVQVVRAAASTRGGRAHARTTNTDRPRRGSCIHVPRASSARSPPNPEVLFQLRRLEPHFVVAPLQRREGSRDRLQ